ncbi:MAG: TnpV protein [Bacillota bacterium]|nr:MAG: TnpV protein [Bacillota bacterium]
MNISYTRKGDYLLPNLILENKEQYNIKKYGLLRLDYIKNKKKSLYIKLLMNDELNKYLHDIDELVEDNVNKLIKLLAEKENINEEMKCNQQLLWIKNMNNIKNRAEEIILKEYIYV